VLFEVAHISASLLLCTNLQGFLTHDIPAAALQKWVYQKNEERVAIQFLVAMKETVGNLHKRLNNVYRNAAFDSNTVGRWAKRVRDGELRTQQLLAVLHQPATCRANNIRHPSVNLFHNYTVKENNFKQPRPNGLSAAFPVLLQI
jgi:hypothetical protein